MKEIFTVTESNDRRYNYTWFTLAAIGVLIPVLTIYYGVFNQAPKFFFTLCIICVVGIYIIRYFFNDHKKLGQLIISENQISSLTANKTRVFSNIKMLHLKYEGYFGSSGMISNFPSKDGTGNFITVTYDSGEKEKINIYLEDREKKEDLVKMLKIFSLRNGIKLDMGSIAGLAC